MELRGPVAISAVSALLLAIATALSAQPLTEQELRGKQIYLEGISPRGLEIEAFIGTDLTALPGAAAACALCHGPDGIGRPEAGVIPSDVTWDYLTVPYGHLHAMDRHHPAYDEVTLAECIVRGADPAGNSLDPSMPVYLMADEDLDDLIAYMKRLQTDYDPGLSEAEIRIGTLMPREGRMSSIARGIGELIGAYFADLNASGGVNTRRLRLIEFPYDNRRQTPLEEATRMIAEGDVFALLSPVVAGADHEIRELAEDHRVPVIGPLTLFSPERYALNGYTFYLYSGLAEQLRALVDFAAGQDDLETPAAALLHPQGQGERYRLVAEAVTEQGARHGWPPVVSVEVPVDGDRLVAQVRELAEKRTEALFVVGSGVIEALAAETERLGWRPYVFLPGAFVAPEILDLPAGLEGRIAISYPTLPRDQTTAASARLRRLLSENGHEIRHRTSQVSALAAATVLVEGLKRAGRDLSRDKLVRALERIYDFETGLTSTITYGANRRIGAIGAYVVQVDLERRTFVPMGEWITPLGDR